MDNSTQQPQQPGQPTQGDQPLEPAQTPVMDNQPDEPVPPAPKKSKKLLIIILILLVLVGGGVAAWLLLSAEDDSVYEESAQSTTPASTVPDVQPESPSPETIQVGQITYELMESGELVTFYDGRRTADENNPYEVNEDTYVTMEIQDDWKVYGQKEGNSPVGTAGIMIEAAPDKYVQIRIVDGVGGECQPNEFTYTLDKRLTTRIDDEVFTQYTVEGREQDTHLSIESTTGYRYEGGSEEYLAGLEAHESLEEGDSNTNSCYIGAYNFIVGSIYITLSDSMETNLSGNLSWDDIKDDQDFIDALQSLTAYEN